MEILKYVLIGFGGLICAYILFRLISMAVFKSWFDLKLQNHKGKEEGDGKSNGDVG